MTTQQDTKKETRKPGFLVRKEVADFERELEEARRRSDEFLAKSLNYKGSKKG